MDLEAILQELGSRFSDVTPFAEGRAGTLYTARDTEQDRTGILKVLHPELTQGSEGMRLKRELTRQLKMSHPNLVLPTATGEAGGRMWLFRAHVEGDTLRSRLDREGTLPVTEALAIVAQLASALDELHRGGMLHRDLKPEHVVLSGEEDEVPRAVLIDASIAAPIEGVSVTDLRGTPPYVSPEQARGKLVSFRSDLYSLGCILHELVAGAPPFPGDDAATVLEAHAKETAPEPPEGLPDDGKLLASLLAKEPRQRPFSAQQVRRQLEPFLPAALRGGAGAARGPAVPGVSPGAASAGSGQGRKRTLVGVPPVAEAPPGRASSAPPAASTDQDWDADHTEQIDATDLLDVQETESSEGPTPSASIPPPLPPGARSAPPPVAEASAPTSEPAPGPAAVPPPPASESERAESPLSSAPPAAPAPSRSGSPAVAPRAEGERPAAPLLVVGGGSFLLGALLSGLLVYVLMSGEQIPEDATAAADLPGSEVGAPGASVPEPPEPAEPEPEVAPAAVAVDAGAAEEGTAAADAGAAADEGEGSAEGAEEDEVSEEEAVAGAEPAADEASAEGDEEGAEADAEARRQAALERRRRAAQRRAARAKAFEEAQQEARAAFRRRDYAGAARAYQRASRINPRHAGSFAGLGAARMAQGKASAAVAAYRQAVRLQPRHAGFWVALGRAQQASGNRSGARDAYQRALKIDPDNRTAKAALQRL